MSPAEYYEQYKMFKDEFSEFFEDVAEEYINIWKLNRLECVPLEYIADTHPTSLHRASAIIKRVENFLENPEKQLQLKGYSLMDLNGAVFVPNKFVNSWSKLSLEAIKIIHVAIYLQQYGMVEQIPRKIVVEINRKYERVSHRKELLEELENIRMCNIKVFSSVEDVKGAIAFEFTESFIEEIDIWKYMQRKMAREVE